MADDIGLIGGRGVGTREPNPVGPGAPDGAAFRQEGERWRDEAPPGEAVINGVAGAAGRAQMIRAQTNKAHDAAMRGPVVQFQGDVYRQTAYPNTYSDHSFSQAGRYNRPGQSALYTAPSLADVQAEAKNYGGLQGTVVRGHFEGDMLDARDLPGVTKGREGVYRGPLDEPSGNGGELRTPLSRLTGESPYTIPRAVGDAARERGLSGVVAPANESHTNTPIFPDDPNRPGGARDTVRDNLAYLDEQKVDGGRLASAHVAAPRPQNIPDGTPNRASPASATAANPDPHPQAVQADTRAQRAGGARYGAAGGAITGLANGSADGRFDGRDAVHLARDTAMGAVAGQVDGALSRGIDGVFRPPTTPPHVAGAGRASGAALAQSAANRPVGFAAGVASGSVIGGVVAGGVAVFENADAVTSGEMSAGQATADVAVDAGVGLGAGAAGAAAGAAAGSVVPVLGTAVGAVVGFAVGTGVAWLAQNSGLADAAKDALGGVLENNFEQPLRGVWHDVAGPVEAAQSAARGVGDGLRGLFG